jgi:hypothetical protein
MALRYALRPEVPGHLGDSVVMDYSTTPYEIRSLHVEMDGWMGDELCAVAGNNYFVSDRLRVAIEAAGLSGCRFESMTVTRSEVFEELQRETELPRFWWLKLEPTDSNADMAIGPGEDGLPTLVVSKRALDCLASGSLTQCKVTALEA